MVIQVDPAELNKATSEQNHEPLAFLGGEFTGSSRHWTTYEKEGFAIFNVFQRLDYMMLGNQKVHIFIDHRNLLFVYAPPTLDPNLGRHVVSKVQRWAMYLSRFEYMIDHIEGSKNIFADILNRWTKGYRSEDVETTQICTLIDVGQIVPSANETEWPSLTDIKHSQLQAESKPANFIKNMIYHMSIISFGFLMRT